MKRTVAALLSGVALVGCGPAAPSGPSPGTAERPPARAGSSGHGYALLYHLVDQERHVSMLLIIKKERDELEKVIDEIDDTCDKAYKRLKEFADADPGMNLDDPGFPLEEARTREAIGETRRHELLDAKGRELEFQLLLVQNEALTYGAHLADTLAREESHPDRLEFEKQLWKDFSRLQGNVRDLLRRPPPPDGRE